MRRNYFNVCEFKGIQHISSAFLSTIILSLIFVSNSFGQATFTSGSTATTLATQMTGPGITISNASITTGVASQAGIFSNGIAGANLQLDTGIALTTGDVNTTFSTNTSTSSVNVAGGTYTDAEVSSLISGGSINDLIIFEFDAVLDPLATVLTIDYQFMSDEYDEYVGSTYNDVFGYFITSDITAPHTGYENFALVPGTTNPVSINYVNNGSVGANDTGATTDLTQSSQFISNNVGSTTVTVEYDGMTKKLRASAKNLTPGTTYHVKLVLADITDSSYDSAILINLISGFPDDDDDGVANDADIDDDNDGILDTEEDANLDNDNNPLTNPTDTDGDGLPNHLDLDSDGDGIPDNIEAQTTNGYIAPVGTFSINGVNTAYGSGLTPVNTDGTADGADYLDTDSDNDGTSDTIEANITLSAPSTVGNNGLDNLLESVDDFLDVNGNLNDPTTLPDTDGDVGTGGDVDYRDTISVGDVDGDGVADTDDYDDDNDGITDAQELCNTDFSIVASSTINVYIDLGAYENEDSWTLTGPGGFSQSGGVYADGDDIIDLDFVVTTAGTYVFTINDTQSDGLDGNGTGGTGGNSNENAQAFYRISLDGNTVREELNNPSFTTQVTNISVTGTPSFSCLTSDPNADDDTDNIPNYADADWATLNSTTIVNGVAASLDFDGDGIINSMDLDADGDGIPDNIEAQPTNTYIAPNASVSATGILTNYGTGLTSLVNTDGTDQADYKDTDADAEGSDDTIEAALTDTLDGVIGPNGLDTAIATTSNYSDVNGIINDPTTLPDSDSDNGITGDVDYRDNTVDISLGSGNILWLRADIEATTTLWQDQSGSDNDAVNATAPTINNNGVNFNPTFVFNGSTQSMQIVGGILETGNSYENLSAYIISKSDIVSNSWIFQERLNNNDEYFLATIPWGDNEIYYGIEGGTSDTNETMPVDLRTTYALTNFYGTSATVINTPTNTRQAIYANGDLLGTNGNFDNSIVGNDSKNFTIGVGDGTQFFDGEIAEIIVFADVPTVTDLQKIQSYLALKYGITLETTDNNASINEGDYILSNGITKVWDQAVNTAYHNDVAGIGRDDTQVLNQKQSKSINTTSIVTMGLGAIAATNAANANTFTTDKDFLVWGNDATTLGSTSQPGVLCATNLQLDRKWKVVETGSVSTVQIAATKSIIDTHLDNATFSKVIKVADDEALTTNVEFISLTTATIDGTLSYVGTYDFDGTKYFTFAEVNGIEWNGSTSSWSGGSGVSGAPNTDLADNSQLLTIDAEGTSNHATLTTNAQVGCVWIKAGSKLNISTGMFLEIADQLQLDGELRLVGSAQLIQTHATTSKVTGSGKLFVDQQGTVTTTFRYNYWTSPVKEIGESTFSVKSVMKDGTTPTAVDDFTYTPPDINFISYSGPYNTLNGDYTTSPITIANYWIYSYINGLTETGWIQQLETGSFDPAEGYILKGPGAVQNYTFVGTPNDGTITSVINPGFSSLMGNPYPSAIDSEAFFTTNDGVVETLYFWEHTGDSGNHNLGGYIGGYGLINASMGLPGTAPSYDTTGGRGEGITYHTPGRYIPVAQGFFVEATDTGGTITFNNGMRAYQKEAGDGVSDNDSFFFKGQTSTPLPVLKIGFDYLNKENIELHRQVGVSFKSGNSYKTDNGFDSQAFDVDVSDVYFKFEGNRENFVIAGIQEITDDLEFPIAVKVGTSGTYKFTVDSKKNINRKVYLTDKVTELKYDLSNLIELALTPGTYEDRFYISFSPKTLSIDDEVLNQEISVYYNSQSKEVKVLRKSNIDIDQIEIYNLLGQKVKKSSNFNQNNKEISLSTSHLSTAVYIVKVSTDKGTVSKKIVINK